jgi:hypothetical protein
MTPKGSFYGPKNVFNRFLVKYRSNGLILMKIAPATFFKRTTGLVLCVGVERTVENGLMEIVLKTLDFDVLEMKVHMYV